MKLKLKRKTLEGILIAGGMAGIIGGIILSNESIRNKVKENYEVTAKYIDKKIGKYFGGHMGPFSPLY